MPRYLYKVSPPRKDKVLTPTRFWRRADWLSSSTRPREGYLEDCVLFAADFDRLAIFLLAPVPRLSLPLKRKALGVLQELGCPCPAASRWIVFVNQQDRETVERFCPTVFTLPGESFEPVNEEEYVTRQPLTALACEIFTMQEVVRRWQIWIVYVPDLKPVMALLNERGLSFRSQLVDRR